MTNDALIAEARKHVGKFTLSKPSRSAASVAAALVSSEGQVYTGVCIDLSCGIGFCAEHAAVAAMLQTRQTAVAKIVAVTEDRILPPCGRCRELLTQIDRRNADCEVIIDAGRSVKLRDLLPFDWF